MQQHFTDEDLHFLQLASQQAEESVREGGGPFGAVIVRDGEIIATGKNRVTLHNDPTAHAEVVAIRQACAQQHTFSLRGTTIYCSCEPCPMCLSAIYWAGINRIIYGNSKEDAAHIHFSDEFIYHELALPKHQRSIPCQHLPNNFTIKAFQQWEEKEDKTEY